MKTIYLIRHAESGWDNTTTDFERVLTEKGIEDATSVSNNMTCNPDIIIASPAVRTTETATIFANALNYNIAEIDYEISIYEAPLQNLINKVNQIDTKHQTAVLVGHNPGITQLANYLADDNLSPVQPCTVMKIELEVDNWNEVIKGIGSILSINQP